MLKNTKNIIPQVINAGSKAIIIGAGRSGIAALRLLLALEVKVCLLEKEAKNIDSTLRQELEAAGVKVIHGEHSEAHFIDVDYIIPSPGIPISTILPLLPANKKIEILAEMELSWRCLQGESVIAITGTSGKTTTASLAAAMIEEHGLKVFLGGNIGTPLSEYILDGKKADVLVLEVSSFQLQACSDFAPNIAVLLNITENHLDYHRDMQEYIDAKFNIFAKQKNSDVAIAHYTLENLVNEYGINARLVRIEKTQNQFQKSNLAGKHNIENIEAAWLACKELGISYSSAAKAVANFLPLAHRLEMVREFEGVSYVNDSKCTTTSSLKVALEAFDTPIILLCGGKFKGGDLHSLRTLIKEKVKHVALFGDSRTYFEQAWQDIVPMSWTANLAETITIARKHAKPNDVVLLAPATASFDLYKNYMARGDDFKNLVGAM